MKPMYVYPIESWDVGECKRRSRVRLRDSFCSLHPWPGLIAGSASSYPEYGQTVRFNGGTIIDGEHYQAAHRPLPVIPPTFRFVTRPTWGTYIERAP